MTVNYTLQPAAWEEITACLEILNSGREFQRQQGFIQWPDGYPARQDIEEDVRQGKGFVVKAGDSIAAYLYIGFDGDPAYEEIVGAWHHPAPYAVIHRIAVAAPFRGTGVADAAFRLAQEHCRRHGALTLRIDTDGENKRMQHVLAKNGFSYCGTVIQGNGPRLAFDKKI